MTFGDLEVRAVADKFTSNLESLGFELPDWCIRPSEALVREFVQRFSLNLPADY